MKHDELTRRALLVGAAALPLAACEAPDGLDFTTVKGAVGTALGITDPPSITLKQASQIPYGTIGYRIGGGGESLLILASQIEQTLLWTSPDRVALSTRGGRIIKSAGFRWNLSDSTFSDDDPVQNGSLLSMTIVKAMSTNDFSDIARYGVPISSLFEKRGLETITILGQELQTISVVETRTCNTFGWSFQNIYWLDSQTGFVWRSEQSIHPNLDAITVETLRPSG